MHKYDAISKLLLEAEARGEPELTVSFERLDALIPGGLPPSARNHRAWWSNGSQYAAAWWVVFGWVVDTVNQSAHGWVRFRRVELDLVHRGGPVGPPTPPTDPAPTSALVEVDATAEACSCIHEPPTVETEADVRVLVPWTSAGPITADAVGHLDFPPLPALPGI